MSERPDLQAAVEWLRWKADNSRSDSAAYSTALLARLEELETELQQTTILARGSIALGVERTEQRDAAEADARAMREAITLFLSLYRGWAQVASHRRLGAAALRGWSPSWYRT